MAEITTFTDYDSIRAVLGVSDEELEDVTLALPIYFSLLLDDLLSFDFDIQGTYEDLVDNPHQVISPLQQRFLNAVQLFSTYSTAKVLLTSLPMFAPRSITDGRAKVDRFSDPLEQVKDGVNLMYNQIRGKLEDLVAELQGTSVSVKPGLTYVVSAGLGYNPITNL